MTAVGKGAQPVKICPHGHLATNITDKKTSQSSYKLFILTAGFPCNLYDQPMYYKSDLKMVTVPAITSNKTTNI